MSLAIARLRVAHLHGHGEPVELAFGQRVGAVLFHRVLGGDHDVRRGQRVGRAFDGDLALLHRLEQRRLGPRRGAVDLVDQHHVGEHRPRHEPEHARSPGRTR